MVAGATFATAQGAPARHVEVAAESATAFAGLFLGAPFAARLERIASRRADTSDADARRRPADRLPSRSAKADGRRSMGLGIWAKPLVSRSWLATIDGLRSWPWSGSRFLKCSCRVQWAGGMTGKEPGFWRAGRSCRRLGRYPDRRD